MAAALGELGAPVPADIQEAAKAAVPLADEQHRIAGMVVGEEVTGLGQQAGEADGERHAPEEGLLLRG